jgi:flavin-dependent dehydrogenase
LPYAILDDLEMTESLKRIAIIGGGPAGSIAAEQLARAGARVTLFEEKGAWEKPCGGGVPYKALRRYPFLREASSEHASIHDAELVAANGSAVRVRLRQPLLIYSRFVLNRLLLQRAREAGAEIVQERIQGFRREGSGWHLEMRGRKSAGGDGLRSAMLTSSPPSYSADYLILSAGARSQLRSLLACPLGARDFMLTFGYYVPAVERLLRVQFFEDFEGYAWSFPRTDHLDLGICGKVGESDMAGLRERLHGFMKRFNYQAESGAIFSHLLPALSVESWNMLRIGGDGWALVGDAAGLVDPLTGEGIYFAMRSGELLAEALLDGEPESYPERIRQDFGKHLALGARLSRYFYHEDFLGKPSTTRLVEFSARSRTFQELLQDLLDGSQSYDGLAVRLYRTLGQAFLETAVGSVVDGIRGTVNGRWDAVDGIR